MSRRIVAAAVAIDIKLGDVDRNLRSIEQGLNLAASRGADLIVLPELATSGFAENAETAEATAISSSDSRLKEVARALPIGVVGVYGFCESADGVLYNSALVVSNRGILHSYRKTHLWGIETQFFQPGAVAAAVVDTPVGKLAVAICYDNEFPEVTRGLALAGAEILALPVNWPRVARPVGEHPPETIQAMAAARSSRLAIVVADRHGVENGTAWTGGTCIISSDGWIEGRPDANGRMALVELELPESGDKKIGEYNDLFADRRPDLYSRPSNVRGRVGN